MAAGFGIEKVEGSIFTNSRVNDALLFFQGDTETIHFGVKKENSVSSILSVSSDIQGSLGTRFHYPVSMDSSISVEGNAVLKGNLTVSGTTTTLNTEIRTTDQLSVVNEGTGPALVVDQKGNEFIAQFRDDGVAVFSILDQGFVGVGTIAPEEILHVIGNIRTSADLIVDASATVGIDLKVKNNLTVDGNSDVVGTSTFRNSATFEDVVVSTDLNVLGTASLSNVDITGSLTVTENTVLSNNLDVVGPSTFRDGAIFEKSVTFESEVGFQRKATFESNVEIQDTVDVLSNLNVKGIGSFSNVDITGSLTVTENTVLSKNLDVVGPSTFRDGAIFEKIATFESEVGFQRKATFESNVEIQDTVDVLSNLNVKGVGSFSNVDITGSLTLTQTTFAGTILPSATETFDLGSAESRWRDLFLSGNTLDINGVRIQKDEETGALRFSDAITGQPNSLVMGELQLGDTQIDGATGKTIKSVIRKNDDGRPEFLTLVLGEDQVFAPDSTVATDIQLAGKITVQDDMTVGGIATMNDTLNVSGNTTLDSNLTVEGIVTLRGDEVKMQSDVDIDGRLVVFNGSETVGPAISVKQIGTEPVAHFFNNNANVMTILDGGNVGIGTSSPIEKLHVVGNILSTEDLKVAGNARIDKDLTIGGVLLVEGGLTITRSTSDDDGDGDGDETTLPSGDNITIDGDFEVTGDMTIGRDLRVIRNSVLEAKVEVNDQLIVSNTGTGPAIQVTQFGDEPVARFFNDNRSVLSILSTGNVGLGIEVPQEKLHVVGNILSTVDLNVGGKSRIDKNHTIGGVLSVEGGTGDEPVARFSNGTQNVLSISNTGDVGIGIEDPQERLHVVGNILSTGDLKVLGELDVKSSLHVENSGSGPAMSVRQNGDQPIAQFFNDDVNVFSIVDGGLVGIGTDAPSAQLHVEGKVFSSSDLIVNGDVGIGIPNPAERLHVDGNILATNDITAQSDRRVKENIRLIENGLEKIERLNGYTFTSKKEDKEGISTKIANKVRMGVIAQELLDIIPEVVHHDEESDLYSVAYGNIVGLLIEGMKDLSKDAREMRGVIRTLTDEVKNLKSESK